jgi:DNA-nicking Smr family endonuclease
MEHPYWFLPEIETVLFPCKFAPTRFNKKMTDFEEFEDPIEIPIDGVLDLHAFNPKEVPQLLDDYFEECIKADILDVRVIHGKGKGILKARVLSLLKKSNLVESFNAAQENWGFVSVRLRRR